jgi:hypothetical protein
MAQHFTVAVAGGAAMAALRGGPARVFAAFKRSCYIETAAGIACLGGPDIGRGPLNVIVEGDFRIPAGSFEMDTRTTRIWKPASANLKPRALPSLAIPKALRDASRALVLWLRDSAERTPDELIGLGPGLTPAGNDALADRVSAWALELAQERTSRISRAHLQCAAAGEGHEALHDFLATFGKESIARLARLGHTSGLDAAAGALLALNLDWRAGGRPS